MNNSEMFHAVLSAFCATDAKRMNCANRRGKYCTPVRPSCECCKDGRCVPLALPPRPDVDANLKSLKIEVK